MPLHDVKCLKCGHIQEAFWQPTEKPSTIKCDKCYCVKTEVMPGKLIIGSEGYESESKLEKQADEMGW